MGQATSSPASAGPSAPSPPIVQRRRPISWGRSLTSFSDDHQNTSLGDPDGAPRPRHQHRRAASFNRLSQLLHSTPSAGRDVQDREQWRSLSFEEDAIMAASGQPIPSSLNHHHRHHPHRASRLQRARTSINTSISNFSALSFRRNTHTPTAPSHSSHSAHSAHSSTPSLQPPTSPANRLDFTLPSVTTTDPLDLDFDHLTTTTSSTNRPATPRTPSRRSSLRLPTGLSDRLDRLSAFGPSRTPRNFRRRPRSPLGASTGGARDGPIGLGGTGSEDNTALLSRLLSVAAAATAATLLEGNQQAIAEARSVAGDGDDGTFNSFLQSLESGRLAAALRGAGHNSDDSSTPPGHAPLNFFRMFRFGSPSAGRSGTNTSASPTAPDAASSSSPDSSNADGRMVPIIIVGIRSVNPGGGRNTDDNGMPPFLDALSALPTTPFEGNPAGHDSIDNILRTPHNSTRFTHRRRASMGGVNSIASGYDAQRHHRSPERNIRPLSMASETPSTPRPPPATPSSPSLSRVASTTSVSPSRPGSTRSTSGLSHPGRESIIRTTTTTTLETNSEDAPLRPRAPRQRRLSESDYRTTFSSRRNGIVEPDNPTPPSENTRSWIIYVLGGSYPENHPILTTPSLFTDSPTYEDMMLLSALLGPAKPPVASEQDVAGAGGIFKIEAVQSTEAGVTLFAVDSDGGERVELVDEQRCLVCLCDFEADEQARQLVKCKHLFHKECIDEWLTKGRNSCPLCRGQGVDEKEKTSAPSTPSLDSSLNTSNSSSSSTSFVDAPPIIS